MKRLSVIFLCLFFVVCCIATSSCKRVEKEISVIVREKGSGTREAFDRVVTDGVRYLEESIDGKKIYHTTLKAIELTKTGTVLYSVASDKNAIGYVSLGALNDSVKTVKIEGYAPTPESILRGKYTIQRPFVVMTNATITLSDRVQDFMEYLYGEDTRIHSEAADGIFLTDPLKRVNWGDEPLPIREYKKKAFLPMGDKIIVRGSTSVEKFINSAAKRYAELYSVKAEEVFDIQLEGTSVGRRAVSEDKKGNVIGLASATVCQEGIKSFNACLDGVAVIVNKANERVSNLTLKQLYDIFSGKINYFRELLGNA